MTKMFHIDEVADSTEAEVQGARSGLGLWLVPMLVLGAGLWVWLLLALLA